MIPSRLATIRAWKERGARIAAVFPAHYPRALFRAFDILPIEVWGPPQADPARGGAHVQPYVCSIVRNALSFILTGGLDVADLLVAPNTCDSLQGLGSILLDFVRPGKPVLPYYIPRGDDSHSQTAFLAAEFHDLYDKLAALTGCSPSDDELLRCNAREEEADAMLADLHHGRGDLPLSQLDFYRIVRAREFLPAEDFIALAKDPKGFQNAADQSGVPVLLSGIVPEPMDLFDVLSAMNGRVVADDLLACGRRLYPAGASDDPFERMAERILSAPPDSTRGSPIDARLAHLRALCADSGARGVIFYDVKFCEPELFYLPTLRRGLQESGIPSTTVEVDVGEPLSGQVKTRLEAFLEMIG